MELDSITKIERFMTDALLSSPAVPLGVNVVRLADVLGEEGILQMVNSMVVRYSASTGNVVRRSPLTLEYTMTFEVNIASQSYLSQSGHDFAVQLCTAARLTLINSVPPNAGVEVVQPFFLASEEFTGLTDSSHYTYTQRWQIVVQDLHRAIAIDPCVQRGDCSKLFPQNMKTRILPGEVVCGNVIYAPVLPPPNDSIPYDAAYLGVEPGPDGDLVYVHDPFQVFMTAAEIDAGYYGVCTNTKDQSGQFEIIDIHEPGGAFVRWYFGAPTGRILLNINEAMVRVNNYSILDALPNGANVEEILPATTMPRNGYGYVSAPRAAFIYADPTNPDAAKVAIPYGTVFPTEDGVTLTVDDTIYIRVGSTPLGRSWIRAIDFTLFAPDQYLPLLDCEEDHLEEGKIDSCD